jgi:hypothetical protein
VNHQLKTKHQELQAFESLDEEYPGISIESGDRQYVVVEYHPDEMEFLILVWDGIHEDPVYRIVLNRITQELTRLGWSLEDAKIMHPDLTGPELLEMLQGAEPQCPHCAAPKDPGEPCVSCQVHKHLEEADDRLGM